MFCGTEYGIRIILETNRYTNGEIVGNMTLSINQSRIFYYTRTNKCIIVKDNSVWYKGLF